MGVYSGFSGMSRYITLKGKTKQKPPEVEEAREGKTAQPGGKRSTTVVGLTTVRPWLPPWPVVVHHGLAVVPTRGALQEIIKFPTVFSH